MWNLYGMGGGKEIHNRTLELLHAVWEEMEVAQDADIIPIPKN